ncbi:hypothetical protein L7F22_053568 [Adiantum nelumboides]|nr:hypothetical protein [Adiantum nelumboides]
MQFRSAAQLATLLEAMEEQAAFASPSPPMIEKIAIKILSVFPLLYHGWIFGEKEDYYIKKFDGTNFTIWKQRTMDVLVNKGLAAPLKNHKESVYNDDQWEELDARARVTICLHLGESIFFTIMNKTTAFELWDSLCLTWDGKSASNKFFLMKKLMRLSMKEGSSVNSHLNEFNALYSQLTSKGLNFDDEMKAIFLLCSLSASWDTFNTAISNSTHGGKLAFSDVTSALLTEEIRRQSLDSGSHGDIANLKKSLSTQFAMKDLGDANHFFGMRIKRDRQRGILELSQEQYVHKVLERFSMQSGDTLSTPMQPCLKLSKDDCPKSHAEKAKMVKVSYSSAVGSLMYAMVATTPDIAFVVGVVSCYMANPGKKHWDAVKHLLKYLKGTVSKCLRFGNSEASIVGYTDADYAGCLDTRKSTSGYVFLFTGAAVSLRSLLQTCTSSSTSKLEYVAASSASKEAVWLARLVGDLGIHQIPVLHCDSQSAITLAKNPVFHSKTKHIEVQYHAVRDIPVLHCDSQSAITLAKNPVFHSKTKHIEVRYHAVRDILATKRIELVKVHTDDNPADALTKSLASERFTHCSVMMGIG